MAKLAVWRMDGQHAAPKRVERSRHIARESDFEDWIVNDVTLIGEGLTLVGRQISIDGGRLDLLAIDTQDRWVVIEIKSGALDSQALTQALYYAESIARLSEDELKGKLEPALSSFGDPAQLLERLNQQLAGEEEGRDIAVLLVGAGIHPGLERVNAFLDRFDVPTSVISFDVFEVAGGPTLLIREVADEPARPAPVRRKLTVDAIRDQAVNVGVGAQFNRFVSMAKTAGLAVQPQRASVRIAPPSNRTRFLMYARPYTIADGGRLLIHAGPKAFAEFFPDIDEAEAEADLKELGGRYPAGKELDEVLDRIERFLTAKVQQSTVDGG